MTANNKLPLLKPKRVKITVSNDVTAGRPRPHQFLHCDWLQPRATSQTRSSAIAEGPRDASCKLKSCQLPRNSAETTCTTSPDQIDGMKLEI